MGQETEVTKLNIVIVEGDGAINNIRQRTARAPIVQVEDQNHRPVAGAAVVFMLPERGATGVFPNGSRTLTVMTDSQGRAVANGIQPNGTPGQMQINVSASYRGQRASALIGQTNVLGAAAAAGGAASKGIGLKLLIVLGAAGAAAATGAIIATHNGGQNTAATTVRPPVSVSPGTGTVGPPR